VVEQDVVNRLSVPDKRADHTVHRSKFFLRDIGSGSCLGEYGPVFLISIACTVKGLFKSASGPVRTSVADIGRFLRADAYLFFVVGTPGCAPSAETAARGTFLLFYADSADPGPWAPLPVQAIIERTSVTACFFKTEMTADFL
jgi:hypothetical protein